MTREERTRHHYDEMIAWASGEKSHWNAIATACQNAGHQELAEFQRILADAAEVQKHAAVFMALRPR